MTNYTDRSVAPRDEEQRLIVRSALNTSLVVEAGAGTGKTTLLIDRLIALALQSELDKLVAVTFTEKAAMELVDRLRKALELKVAAQPDPVERVKLLRALNSLDMTHVSTIHSFASGMVREKAIEAGLDPEFSVIDPSEEAYLRHEALIDSLDRSDRDRDKYLARFLNLGGKLKDVPELCRKLYENRSLIDYLPPPPKPLDLDDELNAILRELNALISRGERFCSDRSDKAYQQVSELNKAKPSAFDSELDMWRWLFLCSDLAKNVGKKSNWSEPAECDTQKRLIAELKDAASNVIREARTETLYHLIDLLREVVANVDLVKMERGVIGFDDQLILARNLLDDPITLQDFRARYDRILIDEFQDTDPLQVWIAMLLASECEASASMEEAQPAVGKLCVIGDPKQSIYRFRRADPAIYRSAVLQVERFGRKTTITRNFRSNIGVVYFVNHFFGQIWDMTECEQSSYVELDPDPEHPLPSPQPPALLLQPKLGVIDNDTKADEVRAMEAHAIAEQIDSLVRDEHWDVCERREDGAWDKRPAKFGDVAVLFTATTNLEYYTNALIDRDVPFHVEGGKRFYQQQIVSNLSCCLTAIDNPRDRLAVVTALRSVFFGVPDDDLYAWAARTRGDLDYRRMVSESGSTRDYETTFIRHSKTTFSRHCESTTADQAIPSQNLSPTLLDALEILRHFHSHRKTWCIDRMIEELFDRTKIFPTLMTRAENWMELAGLRRVLDHAHSHAIEHGPGIRAFRVWLGDQVSEEADDRGTTTPSIDDDRVRLITIHAAKGLEFPIVFLANLGKSDKTSIRVIPDWRNRLLNLSLGSKETKFETTGFCDALDPEKKAEIAENMRLLYVAMTRARDHIVLPIYHRINKKGEPVGTYSGWLVEFIDRSTEAGNLYRIVEHDGSRAVRPKSADAEVSPEEVQSVWGKSEWLGSERGRRLDEAKEALPGYIRPSSHEPEAPSFDVSAPSPAVETRDHAARFGKAFHNYMAHSKPASSKIEQALLTHFCNEEDVEPDRLQALLENCLNSAVWASATSAARMWREAPVLLRLEDGLLHGSLDLLWEDDQGGLHLVDYKTGSPDDARHSAQMRQYAAAVHGASGKQVASLQVFYVRDNLVRDIPT